MFKVELHFIYNLHLQGVINMSRNLKVTTLLNRCMITGL